LEFSDFRHYSLGDDFRYIDWGLYGRTDKLYIKLFKEEEDLLTYIFLDASRSMAYPASDKKFEAAVSIALALAYVALSSGDRVMLRLMAGDAAPSHAGFVYGRHRIVDLGRRLSTVKPAGELDLAQALARELVSVKRAGKVFVISDYQMMLKSVTRGLGLFTAANMDVTAVQVLGGRELAGHGLDGNLELVDSESGEVVRVSIGQRGRQQYHETLMHQVKEVQTFCYRNGLHYTFYTTDRAFQEFFLRAVSELGLVH
jgi:hypothetical protein